MGSHADILDRPEPMSVPFWGSVIMHLTLVGLLLAGALSQNRSHIAIGSPTGGGIGSVMVSPVSTIPLPNRGGPENPVANDTASQLPTPPAAAKTRVKPAPKVKAPPPNAIPLPAEKPLKHPPETPSQPNKFRDQRQYDPSQLYSAAGQRMSSPQFAIQGGGGPTLGDNSPFGQQFGWYGKLIQDNVARNWKPELGMRASSPVVITFTIRRDGSVTNVNVGQSSGNAALDRSAQRAVMDAQLSALPPQFPKNQADVELKFELGK
jgi:periplasmic protein TonB